MKLEEIHRYLAILQLQCKSRALGPQRAGGRQRVNFGIVGDGLRLMCMNSRILAKFEEVHRNLAILPLQWKSSVCHKIAKINPLSPTCHFHKISPNPTSVCKGLKLPLKRSDGGWICINCRVLTKLERIHRNQAILPLHWESRSLGPQRAGGRQRVKTTIGRVGWRLNLCKWSSFREIIRKSSKLGNIATTLGIEGPESSASRWETKGWFWHCRCQMMIINQYINSGVLIRLEEILRKLAILPLHSESGALGLGEQVGDKGLILAF